MLPIPLPDQIPDTWHEHARDEPKTVVWRDDSNEFAVNITNDDTVAGTYNTRLLTRSDSPVETGAVLAETAAKNRQIALATAIGYMQIPHRLQQDHMEHQ